MLKKRMLALALAVLLALSLLPAAGAADFGSIFDSLEQLDDLREWVDKKTGSLTISGSVIGKESLVFLDDFVVGDKIEERLCEIKGDSYQIDESRLPPGCRVELRREKEDKENRESREADYLYLIGTLKEQGNHVFYIMLSDNFYLCYLRVLAK